jgi:hypothetical protein
MAQCRMGWRLLAPSAPGAVGIGWVKGATKCAEGRVKRRPTGRVGRGQQGDGSGKQGGGGVDLQEHWLHAVGCCCIMM